MKSIKLTCPIVKKDDGHFSLKLPDEYQRAMHDIMEYCFENRGGYCSFRISPPVKKKSTGYKSQNSHFHGHVATIAESTGQPVKDVKKYLKDEAVGRGYPMLMSKGEDGEDLEPILDMWGNVQGASMEDISSGECALLIDEAHQFAAENNITLIEG